MSENARTFGQIVQEVQQIHPEAKEGYIRRLADNIINEITVERNLKKKTHPISTVDGQMLYDLTDLGSVKISRVDFMDNDGKYVKIPRLLDGESIREWDQT